jgi:uncharacterized membrane protein
MIRSYARVLALLCVTLSTSAAAAMDFGVDRPGMDYRVFALPAADPAACAATCRAEKECQAWSYVKPGYEGPQARCRLKHTVPGPATRECCISGLKYDVASPPQTASRYEVGVDRPGLDFRVFALASADPAACEAQCQADKECVAWTYVKPGYEIARARCRLKHTVPGPTPRECCISGVKQAKGGLPSVPWQGSASASTFRMDSATVAEIQRLLSRLGYDPGPADGAVGPRTRQAVRAFQRDSGLLADGALRSSLLDRLRQRAAARPGTAASPTPAR